MERKHDSSDGETLRDIGHNAQRLAVDVLCEPVSEADGAHKMGPSLMRCSPLKTYRRVLALTD